ncbi:MAG: YggS family pyridoxal phosphate-dependent enzyme [Bacteroidia bacterium]|nr:YggS family pyridoxal phosphate-dependent enzyme [Bacteroidia bacterium]
MSLSQNLEDVRSAIKGAAARVGKSSQEITLIAVSKTKPMDSIKDVFRMGQRDFGENKVQELREKQPQLPEARWHLIGTLQRNKVKYIAPFVYLIHSVDSARLLEEINYQAEKNERVIPCLFQLNISEENSKSGMNEAECEDILRNIDKYPHVMIQGLMGMAEFTDDETTIRSQFRRLKKAAADFSDIIHPRISMEILSMGMSGDFEIAIEEGSTMVRVGSLIFGER